MFILRDDIAVVCSKLSQTSQCINRYAIFHKKVVPSSSEAAQRMSVATAQASVKLAFLVQRNAPVMHQISSVRCDLWVSATQQATHDTNALLRAHAPRASELNTSTKEKCDFRSRVDFIGEICPSNFSGH